MKDAVAVVPMAHADPGALMNMAASVTRERKPRFEELYEKLTSNRSHLASIVNQLSGFEDNLLGASPLEVDILKNEMAEEPSGQLERLTQLANEIAQQIGNVDTILTRIIRTSVGG